MKILHRTLCTLFLCGCILLSGCAGLSGLGGTQVSFSMEDLPAFSGDPYVVIDDNQPDFPQADRTTESFESYSPLDLLGRCGPAYANVGQDLMPTEERGEIGQVKPTGWQTVKYDIVDGKYLYNRCHLIGYQLTGENANEENLITGTRYMNVEGMLPFEDAVADYVQETGNHVLYRVTPVFEDLNLVADGVQMEAYSVEDEGAGVCFNVYVYNVQPGVEIDYATGESWLDGEEPEEQETPAETVTEPMGEDGGTTENTQTQATEEATYILNTNSHKFHLPDCSGAASISDANRQEYTGSREDLIAQGYAPCKQCNP